MEQDRLNPKKVDSRVINLGDRTGSDHLYDDHEETGKGDAVKRAKINNKNKE